MIGEIPHLAGQPAIHPVSEPREIRSRAGSSDAHEFKAALGGEIMNNAAVY
jgi:hypothetical protein